MNEDTKDKILLYITRSLQVILGLFLLIAFIIVIVGNMVYAKSKVSSVQVGKGLL